MTPSFTAIAVALAIGLQIFALGELIRGRKERRPRAQHTPSPERTSHE